MLSIRGQRSVTKGNVKCPRCTTESKKTERPEGKCPKCGYGFVFDPPNPLSDYAISQLIDKLSSSGMHSFTREQLVCEVERGILKKGLGRNGAIGVGVVLGFVCLVITGVITSAVGVAGLLAAIPLLLLDLFLVVMLIRGAPRHASEASDLVRTYLGAVGPPAKMISERAHPAEQNANQATAREFDLESYGFDRIVAVQHHVIVDMLVANQFHVQHNAAIVSFDGYPSHVARLVGKQIGSGQVNAPVFVLHDASPVGLLEAHRWLGSGWLGNTPVVRVGLFPAQSARLRPQVPISPTVMTMPDGTSVNVDSQVPLAALRPVQIMNLLLNAFQKGADEGSTLVFWESSDGGSYDFG
ncbi:MAG: hypothetical protein U0165_05180 [Polyangiaceae bacterium]